MARLKLLLITIFLTASVSQVGCVQRRMLVNSFPEGASVTVDGQHVGYTPLAVDYLYYGTREILLEKDGFKPIRVMKDFQPPWYQYPPFNLVSDNLAFRHIRDSRILEFQMQPVDSVDQKQLIDRAEQLRGDVLKGSIQSSNQNAEYQWKN